MMASKINTIMSELGSTYINCPKIKTTDNRIKAVKYIDHKIRNAGVRSIVW